MSLDKYRLEFNQKCFAELYSIIKELFVPLISIEIESSINKHLNGGIFNMSKNSYVGVLVTYEQAQKHVMYFRQELGLKNVISYQIK